MTLDLFKRPKFSPGQEIQDQDLTDLGRFLEARLADQFFGQFAVNLSNPLVANVSSAPGIGEAYALTVGGGHPRQGSTFRKINIAPGTLMQKIENMNGNSPTMLMYTFNGTEEVSLVNGDPTNPRVDLVQMKLELVDDDLQGRAFLQNGAKASLNCATITVVVNTVVQARVIGTGGNSISLAFVADGSGAGSLTVSGNTVTFHYQGTVTTVANFETAIAGITQPLLEVQAVGTGTNVLTTADAHVAALLAGGVDTMLVSQNFNMKTRVQCTLNVKQGTPAVSPIYPIPDAGFVAIAGCVVGTNWTAGFQPKFDDQAGATLTIHDIRMPIRLRSYRTPPALFVADFLNTRARQINGFSVVRDRTDGIPSNIIAPVQCGGNTGRLVSYDASLSSASVMTTRLIRYVGGANDAVSNPNLSLAEAGLTISPAQPSTRISSTPFYFQSHHLPEAGPIVLPNANGLGPPIWTNGFRGPSGILSGTFSVVPVINDESAALIWVDPVDASAFRFVTFYIAEGL